MRKVFINRAKRRSIVAYILLSVAILVIVVATFVALYLTIDLSMQLGNTDIPDLSKAPIENAKLQLSTYQIKFDNLKFKYTALTILLVSMLLFVSQVLLRLYRYNMLKADFYFACADSFILTQKFNADEKEKFQTILTTIISEKISLTTPPPPTFSFFGSKDKGAG